MCTVTFPWEIDKCYQKFSDLHTVRKNCSSGLEKLLKFEAEGREFAKFLRSLEQFIQKSERSEQFLVKEKRF